MRLNRNAAIALSLLLLSVFAGCARTVNMNRWEKDVEKYVQQTGGGDPGVLRDVTIAGDRRGFAVIGKDHPRQSTDANGVLLAHKNIADRPWFIYLVGVVDEQKVKEIRLAAGSIVGGDATWCTSRSDKEALRKYRDYGLAQWNEQSHGQGKPPPEYTTFPRPPDSFDVTVSGSAVQATHRASGAQWEVNLDGKRR